MLHDFSIIGVVFKLWYNAGQTTNHVVAEQDDKILASQRIEVCLAKVVAVHKMVWVSTVRISAGWLCASGNIWLSRIRITLV